MELNYAKHISIAGLLNRSTWQSNIHTTADIIQNGIFPWNDIYSRFLAQCPFWRCHSYHSQSMFIKLRTGLSHLGNKLSYTVPCEEGGNFSPRIASLWAGFFPASPQTTEAMFFHNNLPRNPCGVCGPMSGCGNVYVAGVGFSEEYGWRNFCRASKFHHCLVAASTAFTGKIRNFYVLFSIMLTNPFLGSNSNCWAEQRCYV